MKLVEQRGRAEQYQTAVAGVGQQVEWWSAREQPRDQDVELTGTAYLFRLRSLRLQRAGMRNR